MVDRRRATLYAATTLMCMSYGLMAPFIPIIAKDKGLSELHVGLIVSAFPFASIVVSPLLGSFLYLIGRRNALGLAFLLLSLCYIAVGVSVNLEETWFFVINFLCRISNGISFAFLFTVVTSVLATDYPDKVFEYVGINESMAGLGFLLGPLAGAGLYVTLGFAGTFFFASGFCVLAGITVFTILSADRQYNISPKQESIMWIVTRPRIVVTMLPLMFACAVMGAQNVFVPTHLEDSGLERKYIALAFCITGIGYLLTCLVLSKAIENWNKKLMNALGCGVSMLSIALIGPWPTVIPVSIEWILVGFALMPLGLGILFVESIPSLIEVATHSLGLEYDDKLLDKLSALNSFGSSCGELVGPLLIGALIPMLGIQNSCGIMAGLGLCVLLVYVGTFLFDSLGARIQPLLAQ